MVILGARSAAAYTRHADRAWSGLAREVDVLLLPGRDHDMLVDPGARDLAATLLAAAVDVVAKGHGRIAIGDIGFEHGGDIPGHTFHEYGLEVDVRPMRTDKRQCSWGGSYRLSTYDRAATRDLIRAIRASAPGHVRLIYFNDPVLIREGLTRRFRGHDDHLHIRYCEKVHPVAAYDC